MALEYGFYDSMNGDRRYSATQMSEIFEGLITDGVYAAVGDKFFTTVGDGLQVIVGTGRAWFQNTWNRNKAPFPLAIDKADPAFDRIDSVCIQVYAEDSVRENTLMVVKGSVAVNPEPPIFPSSSQRVYWLRLANVRVRAGTDTIRTSDIDIRVGSSDCPFVTSIVQQTNIDQLFASWDEQFNDWWDSIKAVLDENVATNLQNQITSLGNSITTINATLTSIPSTYVAQSSKATTTTAQAGADNNQWMTPATTKAAAIKYAGIAGKDVGDIVFDAGGITDPSWHQCDGSRLSQIDYATLFGLIGDRYFYISSANATEEVRLSLTNVGSLTAALVDCLSTGNYSRPGCALISWSTALVSGTYNRGSGYYNAVYGYQTWGIHPNYGSVRNSGYKYGTDYNIAPSLGLGDIVGSTYQNRTGYIGRSTSSSVTTVVFSASTQTNYRLAGFFIDYTGTSYYVAYNTSTREITLYEGSTTTSLGSYTSTNYPIMFCGSVFWSNGSLQTYRPTASSNNMPVPSLTLTQYNNIKGKRVRHSDDFRTMLVLEDSGGIIRKFAVPSGAGAGASTSVTETILNVKNSEGASISIYGRNGCGVLFNPTTNRVLVFQLSSIGGGDFQLGVGTEDDKHDVIVRTVVERVKRTVEEYYGVIEQPGNENAMFAPCNIPSNPAPFKITTAAKSLGSYSSSDGAYSSLGYKAFCYPSSGVISSDNTFVLPYILTTEGVDPKRTAAYIKVK